MAIAKIKISVCDGIVTINGFDNILGASEVPASYTTIKPFFYKTKQSVRSAVDVVVLLCDQGIYSFRTGDDIPSPVFDIILTQMRIAGDRLHGIRKKAKTIDAVVEI